MRTHRSVLPGFIRSWLGAAKARFTRPSDGGPVRCLPPTPEGGGGSQFDFSVSGSIGTVQSVTLRLRVTDSGPDNGAAFSVSNNGRGSSTARTENALTWNNAPAWSGSVFDEVTVAGSVSSAPQIVGIPQTDERQVQGVIALRAGHPNPSCRPRR